MGEVSFRRLTRDDFPVLAGWLAEPHVARWWNHDVDAGALERDFGASADGAEPNEDWLVLFAGRPVGLIQYSRYDDYPEYRDELAPYVEVPTGTASIDYLLGDPSLTGQGLGTSMIEEFVERIWATAPHGGEQQDRRRLTGSPIGGSPPHQAFERFTGMTTTSRPSRRASSTIW